MIIIVRDPVDSLDPRDLAVSFRSEGRRPPGLAPDHPSPEL